MKIQYYSIILVLISISLLCSSCISEIYSDRDYYKARSEQLEEEVEELEYQVRELESQIEEYEDKLDEIKKSALQGQIQAEWAGEGSYDEMKEALEQASSKFNEIRQQSKYDRAIFY